MSTKIRKARNKLNNQFRDTLIDAVREKYGIELEHEWVGFFSDDGGRLVTTRTDGVDFTPEQHAFLGAYSEGYAAAMKELEDCE